MNTKIICCITFVAVLIYACRNVGQKENVDTENIIVDLQQADKSPYISNLEQIELIPLETNDSCIIGTSHLLRIDDEKIVIVSDQSREICIFTLSGKFICTISKAGQGPQEYLRIDDIQLHPETKNIEVLDGMQNKILEYTKHGEFVSEKKIPLKVFFNKFFCTKNNQFVLDRGIPFDADSSQYSVYVLLEDLTPKAKLFPYKKASHFYISPRQTIQNVEDQLYYLPVYSQTLYKMENFEITAEYVYSFGKHDMDMDFLWDYPIHDPFKLIEKLKDCNFIYFFNLTVSGKQILADFLYRNTPYFHVYDLETKSRKLFIDENMKDCGSAIIPLTSKDGKFVSVLYPEQLHLLRKFHQVNDIPSLNDDDNMLIIKYKFKI
jgi:hypothetical protein